MPDNTIRIGAVIDASGIPGGLQTILDAQAKLRADIAITSVLSKEATAQFIADNKAAASASAENAAAASAAAGISGTEAAKLKLILENMKSTLNGVNLQWDLAVISHKGAARAMLEAAAAGTTVAGVSEAEAQALDNNLRALAEMTPAQMQSTGAMMSATSAAEALVLKITGVSVAQMEATQATQAMTAAREILAAGSADAAAAEAIAAAAVEGNLNALLNMVPAQLESSAARAREVASATALVESLLGVKLAVLDVTERELALALVDDILAANTERAAVAETAKAKATADAAIAAQAAAAAAMSQAAAVQGNLDALAAMTPAQLDASAALMQTTTSATSLVERLAGLSLAQMDVAQKASAMALIQDIVAESQRKAAVAATEKAEADRKAALAATQGVAAMAAMTPVQLAQSAALMRSTAAATAFAEKMLGVSLSTLSAADQATALAAAEAAMAAELELAAAAARNNAAAVDQVGFSAMRARIAARGLTSELGGPLSFVMGNLATQSSILGKVFAAAFPVVAALAAVEIVADLGEKVYEFYKRAEEGAERVQGEWAKQNLELINTNDELDLSNDKLDNQLAKLTGQHENSLKIMLDDAVIAADALAKSLEKVNAESFKLLEKEKVGFLKGLVTWTEQTDNFSEREYGGSGVGGRGAERQDAILSYRQQILEIKQREGTVDEENAARGKAREAVERNINQDISERLKRLGTLSGVGAPSFSTASPTGAALESYFSQIKGAYDKIRPDYKVNIELTKAELRSLREQLMDVDKEFAAIGKKQAVHKATVDHANEGTAHKAAEAKLHAWEEELAFQESQSAKSVAERLSYWKQIATANEEGAMQDAAVRRAIAMKIGALSQEQYKLDETALKAHIKQQADALAEQTNQQANVAEEGGGQGGGRRGELGSLQQRKGEMLEGVLSATTADEAMPFVIEYNRIVKMIPAVTREAFKESEDEVKKSLEEQFKAFEINGTKALSQQKQFWADQVQTANLWIDSSSGVIHGLEGLSFAEEKWADASRKAADEAKKLTAELRNMKIAAEEAAQIHGIAMQREALKGQRETRLLPATNEQKVQDLQADKALDVQQGDVEQGGLYKKAQASDLDLLADKTPKNIEANEAAWEAYQKAVQKTQLKIAADNNAIAKQMITPWQQAFSTLESGFEKAVSNMIIHGKGFGQTMRQTLQSLEETAVRNFVRMGEQFIIMEFKKLAAHVATDQGQVASTATSTATGQSISMAAHIKGVVMDAEGAAAGAFKWVMKEVPPPFSFPLAAAAAAGAFAGVLAFGSAEQGGIMPNTNTLLLAHPGEMMLPRPISTGIQQMIASAGPGGPGGGGGQTIHNYGGIHNHLPPGASPGDFGRATVAALKRHARDNHQRS